MPQAVWEAEASPTALEASAFGSARGLYREDEGMERRESHNNPSIQKLYKDYLGKPNSERAHKLLHTSYIARPIKIVHD